MSSWSSGRQGLAASHSLTRVGDWWSVRALSGWPVGACDSRGATSLAQTPQSDPGGGVSRSLILGVSSESVPESGTGASSESDPESRGEFGV